MLYKRYPLRIFSWKEPASLSNYLNEVSVPIPLEGTGILSTPHHYSFLPITVLGKSSFSQFSWTTHILQESSQVSEPEDSFKATNLWIYLVSDWETVPGLYQACPVKKVGILGYTKPNMNNANAIFLKSRNSGYVIHVLGHSMIWYTMVYYNTKWYNIKWYKKIQYSVLRVLF